jgi:hypothetical protein
MTVEVIPAEILTQHTGVLGKTGSGKTTTGKLIVERVVKDGYRVCILDPIKSDWWGISTSVDGKKPGLPFVILGGPYGHVPISTSSAAAIGELVGSGELPLSVLDLANLEPGGVQKFFVHFAETLWRTARRGVLYLVLEEAHEFAPKERAGFGSENLSIHWAKKLATGARAKGIRLVVSTQRTQALHNAVLGSCETMIVHRLTQPADQKPGLGWLRANVQDAKVRHEIESTMSSLKTGTGWLCSGEAQIFRRVQFPRISTYDNSATPIVRPADVDVGALKEALRDAVAQAEANDPEMLRKRIRDLEQRANSLVVVTVTDAATFTRGGLNLRELKTLQDEVEREEKRATSPLNEALQVVRGWFRGMKDKLAAAELQQRRLLGDYKREADRREAEERRRKEAVAQAERDRLEREARAREDAARKEAEDKRRQAEEERRAGNARVAAKLESQATSTLAKADAAASNLLARAEAVTPEPVVSQAPKVAGLGNRKVWDYEILDEALIDRRFFALDHAKIRDQVKAMKGDAVSFLGGAKAVRVFETDDFSARRTR